MFGSSSAAPMSADAADKARQLKSEQTQFGKVLKDLKLETHKSLPGAITQEKINEILEAMGEGSTEKNLAAMKKLATGDGLLRNIMTNLQNFQTMEDLAKKTGQPLSAKRQAFIDEAKELLATTINAGGIRDVAFSQWGTPATYQDGPLDRGWESHTKVQMQEHLEKIQNFAARYEAAYGSPVARSVASFKSMDVRGFFKSARRHSEPGISASFANMQVGGWESYEQASSAEGTSSTSGGRQSAAAEASASPQGMRELKKATQQELTRAIQDSHLSVMPAMTFVPPHIGPDPLFNMRKMEGENGTLPRVVSALQNFDNLQKLSVQEGKPLSLSMQRFVDRAANLLKTPITVNGRTTVLPFEEWAKASSYDANGVLGEGWTQASKDHMSYHLSQIENLANEYKNYQSVGARLHRKLVPGSNPKRTQQAGRLYSAPARAEQNIQAPAQHSNYDPAAIERWRQGVFKANNEQHSSENQGLSEYANGWMNYLQDEITKAQERKEKLNFVDFMRVETKIEKVQPHVLPHEYSALEAKLDEIWRLHTNQNLPA